MLLCKDKNDVTYPESKCSGLTKPHISTEKEECNRGVECMSCDVTLTMRYYWVQSDNNKNQTSKIPVMGGGGGGVCINDLSYGFNYLVDISVVSTITQDNWELSFQTKDALKSISGNVLFSSSNNTNNTYYYASTHTGSVGVKANGTTSLQANTSLLFSIVGTGSLNYSYFSLNGRICSVPAVSDITLTKTTAAFLFSSQSNAFCPLLENCDTNNSNSSYSSDKILADTVKAECGNICVSSVASSSGLSGNGASGTGSGGEKGKDSNDDELVYVILVLVGIVLIATVAVVSGLCVVHKRLVTESVKLQEKLSVQNVALAEQPTAV